GAHPYIAPAVYCGAGGLVTDCRIVNAYNGDIFGEGIYLDRSRLRNSFISGFTGGDESAGGWAVDAHWSTIEGSIISPTSRWGGSGAFLDNCLMDTCVVAHNSHGGCWFGMGGGGILESNSLILNSLIVSNAVF